MATGANASVLYGFELTSAGAVNFGAGADEVNKEFGYGLEFSLDTDRSMNFRYGPGSRNWQAAKAGKFAGTWKADFDLCDPWVLEAVIGLHGSITGSSGSYAATFSESDNPSTLEIDVCQAVVPGTTYALRKLYGCVVKTASFGWEGGSDTPIRMSLDGEYSNEALSAPVSFTAQTLPDQAAPLTFANCTLATSANGTDYTTITNVDKCDIKIDNGTELRWSGGSDKASRVKYGERKYELSVSHLLTSTATFLEKLFGASGGPTASNPTAIAYLKVTLSAETSATMSWVFTNVIIGKHSNEGITGPADELIESVELTAQSCSVVLAGWDNTEPARYSA